MQAPVVCNNVILMLLYSRILILETKTETGRCNIKETPNWLLALVQLACCMLQLALCLMPGEVSFTP
jgi:hypothetical protein